MLPPVEGILSADEVNSYITSNLMLLNKIEMENLASWYGAAGGIDLATFLSDLATDTAGDDPRYTTMYAPESAHEAHLALSGVSHIEFGTQDKPFPKHWGVPPNAQMKGHDGIMRELPGGYGKGNAPMYNWVAENLKKDKKSETNERGVKPFPYGNYSL